MAAGTPQETLHKFYAEELKYTSSPAGPEPRDFSAIAGLFSKDFILHQSSALPWAGTYHGPGGMKTWMDTAAKWTSIDVRDAKIFEISPPLPHQQESKEEGEEDEKRGGDSCSISTTTTTVMQKQIMVSLNLTNTSTKSGKSITLPMAQLISFSFENGPSAEEEKSGGGGGGRWLIKEIRPFYWDVKALNEVLGFEAGSAAAAAAAASSSSS